MKIVFALIAMFLTASVHAEDSGLLPNSSLEEIAEGRPKGWRLFTLPEEAAVGVQCVMDGKEGEGTHSGLVALQFAFPEEVELSQAVWSAAPNVAGMAIEPGEYNCSFWIKATEMSEGFHVWLRIVGFDSNQQPGTDIARSDFLRAKDFPDDSWVRISFPFEVPADSTAARIVPNIVFKTSSRGDLNPVPPTTRILVDDIEITKN
jgi:hypothetical protein